MLALVVAVLVGVAVFSPALDVRSVEVVGAGDETRPLVEAAAAVRPGTSLVWLDTAQVAGRDLAIPRVATVDVRRSPPSTVTVTVTERTPVAAVAVPGGDALVDGTGVAYRVATDAPAGVPVLRLPPGVAPSPADPTTVAAVRVVAALPPDLARRVTDVRASGPNDVGLTLDDGRVVRWGGDEQDERKAAVLRPLLTRPGRTVDVSAPESPVTS